MSTPFKPRPGVAWLVILVAVGVLMTLVSLSEDQAGPAAVEEAQDSVLQLQVQMVLASESIMPGSGEADTILNPDQGSIGRGFRVIAAWAAVAGPEVAREKLVAWRQRLSERGEPFNAQQQVLAGELDRVLSGMANDGVKASIEEHLGWFGALALAGSSGSEEARREALRPIIDSGLAVLGVVSIFTIGIGGLAVIGFFGLIAAGFYALNGKIASRVGTASHDGVYAETFAVWLILFQLLSIPAALVGVAIAEPAPDLAILPSICVFFLSLLALYWPVLRGLSWAQVRRDVGLTPGSGVFAELGCGLAGYAMALPIAAVGLMITVLLFILSGEDAGGSSAAHPIAGEVEGASTVGLLMIYILASVAAPIVEEVVFRGVLYRQVRSWLAARAGETTPFLWFGLVVMPSALMTSAVFAAVHPQGVLAIPALAALAFAFCLAREWRGSLISPMVMHGVSNGVVMTLLVLMMG